MTVSSLISSNPTILKPSEQTPIIAQAFISVLHEVGVPKEALCLAHGLGEEIGAWLVNHEKIAAHIFTGSKDVGSYIFNQANSQTVFHSVVKRYVHKKAI